MKVLKTVCQLHAIYLLIFSLNYFISPNIFPNHNNNSAIMKAFYLQIVLLAIVFLISAYYKKIGFRITLLAIGSALVLSFIDISYALEGKIEFYFLTDALIQVIIIVSWIVGYLRFARYKERVRKFSYV